MQVVVSDKPACGATQFAQDAGYPIINYPDCSGSGAPENEPELSAKALQALLADKYRVDFVILAGYLKVEATQKQLSSQCNLQLQSFAKLFHLVQLVPAEVVRAYHRAILNIHPALLPAFGGKGLYGSRVHQAVIASGTRFTGPTVHFVDGEYDTGPILAQRVIPVNPFEDYKQLGKRVLQEEHILYPEVISALVERRISWRSDNIPVLWNPF